MKSIFLSGILFLSTFYSLAQTEVEKKVALYREIGIANYWEFNFSYAIAKLAYVIKNAPQDHEAIFYRGLCYGNMKNYAAALKDFNAAINIHTSNADYYLKRADCLYGLHRWEKAVFAYEEAIEKISGVSGKEEALALMYFNKGLAQVQLKNWSAACKDFTESAKLGFLEAEDSYGKLCKGSKYDQ